MRPIPGFYNVIPNRTKEQFLRLAFSKAFTMSSCFAGQLSKIREINCGPNRNTEKIN
jgi:hypothetical protein